MEETKNWESVEVLEENHQGRNAQRIRIYFGIKQEVLAKELDISQSQLSLIEHQPVIEESMLNKLSQALGVSPDIIKKFDVARAIYNINNYRDTTINGSNSGSGTAHQHLNPIDKVVELYERLLNSEREKLELYINNKK
ncbi:helix-turn-helix domain-containing protein [Parafilimonas sp.]|uniref:helix-turn-helix domain-containing protein n=1 Tax=Parafilimonas sp. TaxID=1969739 RepID=UPI0039E61C4F